MNTDQMIPKPMTEDQLEYIKDEIKKTYLYLISHTEHDPQVVEIMKLSALAVFREGLRPGSLGDFRNIK